MTPKQAAARLLLSALEGGRPPGQLTAPEMTEALGTRISDQKREKILEFVEKIAGPFRDRLQKLKGEDDKAGSAEA